MYILKLIRNITTSPTVNRDLNNRMGNTRSLQENQRSKGTFHAKMGTIKDRNGMDLTEAEDIRKRWK